MTRHRIQAVTRSPPFSLTVFSRHFRADTHSVLGGGDPLGEVIMLMPVYDPKFGKDGLPIACPTNTRLAFPAGMAVLQALASRRSSPVWAPAVMAIMMITAIG